MILTRMGKANINSWEKFKKHMWSAFFPYNYERELYQRFHLLRQGNRFVNDYTTELYKLLARTKTAKSPL